MPGRKADMLDWVCSGVKGWCYYEQVIQPENCSHRDIKKCNRKQQKPKELTNFTQIYFSDVRCFHKTSGCQKKMQPAKELVKTYVAEEMLVFNMSI